MATKVPDSTRRCRLRLGVAQHLRQDRVLVGPKRLDCRPARNSAVSSRPRLAVTKPRPASAITRISKPLAARIRLDLSYLSAIWPAVAENRTNGKMNSPAARLTRTPLSRPENAELSPAKRAV